MNDVSNDDAIQFYLLRMSSLAHAPIDFHFKLIRQGRLLAYFNQETVYKLLILIVFKAGLNKVIIFSLMVQN